MNNVNKSLFNFVSMLTDCDVKEFLKNLQDGCRVERISAMTRCPTNVWLRMLRSFPFEI